jgi:hypothetical protein
VGLWLVEIVHSQALKKVRHYIARRGGIGGYLRAFKAEPSSFAVTSTMGITRS